MSTPETNRKRILASFWIFGLCNNFGYVVMLSAAYDLVSRGTSSYCTDVSTGTILLADILPTLFIKLVAPAFVHKIHYNVKVTVCVAIAAASFLMVASSNIFGLIIGGVMLASLSSGFGEVTFLALSSHFERSVITAWSSGTGFAGIMGSGLYLLLNMVLSPRNTIYIMIIVPVIELLAYWLLLVHPATLNEPAAGFKPLVEEEEEEATSSTKLAQPAQPPTLIAKCVHTVKELWYYMLTLFLVYICEYLINQGIFEILCYQNSPWKMSTQYRTYQLLYQVGVTISRSSASIIHFRQIHIFAILQFFNLILFAMEARYSFIPSIWITFVLVVWEGLLGGLCYVNAFYRIYQEVPHNTREFSLGLVSVSDSMGITLAGIISIPLHNYICRFRHDVPINSVCLQ